MISTLKTDVLLANKALKKYELVKLTWGNVSAIDRLTSKVIIKPSGIEYDDLNENKLVVVDLFSQKVIESSYKPSTDTQTHLFLYKANNNIGSIIHTHSTYATAFAQAKVDIPICGTTASDYFKYDIPCTDSLTDEEINNNYEENIAHNIINTFKKKNIDMMDVPAVLVASHGVFCWGHDVKEALEKAIIVEEVAKNTLLTKIISKDIETISHTNLHKKHFYRKHGSNAYYGQ